MLNRYRVLNAILALREFTVADLAHYSGAKDNTVRTVLSRDARFVERVGTQAQGRRGGQPIQYRLCTATEDELVGMLREVDTLGVDLPPLPEGCSDVDPVVMSLKAAEDVLLRQLPAAANEERAQLLSLAAADLEMVQFLADHGEAAVHREVVDLLLRLAEVEQEAAVLTRDAGAWLHRQDASALAAPSHEAEKQLEALGRDLYKLLQVVPAVSKDDPLLLSDLFRRIGTSPFGAVIAKFCTPEPRASEEI
ncbi:hypothetical protein [Couchioplanes caeruleus]|uniref:Uncharacterized protein n=3 Tax=Couchioplanes caeruleus TaxID=56438 RepID=A0A1K0FNT7_9ACTN|nr:hypothetical protein [Couchioplanes caeruleus]OJF14501.1 hypothetical protein BG844_09170 [Couchioplanes caeruleus subsp. caeruleus]ROP21237.1 hypothetical protein EDD30_7632 [Couchioplanes caeruleus]